MAVVAQPVGSVIGVARRRYVVRLGVVEGLAGEVFDLFFEPRAVLIGDCPLAGDEVGAEVDDFRAVLGAQEGVV